MVAVVALLLPVPGHALTAEAGLLGSAIAAASDMTSPGNALTLALVGVWLSLFETASRNAGLARAGFGLAGAQRKHKKKKIVLRVVTQLTK
jgi:hypothetical protein